MKFSTIQEKYIYVLVSILVIGGSFGVGMYTGTLRTPAIDKVDLLHKQTPVSASSADFNTFWQVWNTINEKAYDGAKISDTDKVYGATAGLVASLKDPYTVFFPPTQSKAFNETIGGSFGGVGMELGMKDNALVVIAPLKGTPAYTAHIQKGDYILKINDATTEGMSIEAAVNVIRGAIGTTVKLSVFSKGDDAPRDVVLTRENIEAPTLDEKKDGDIYVVSLYSFNANATSLMATALQHFKDSGLTKLIIDLRGNPGGYLDSAVSIASYFLPRGDVIVSEDFGSHGAPIYHKSLGYGLFDKKPQVVLLVDGGSASASEILAGALKEHGVATLVGEKTFGKGSVQEVIPVTDDTTLKITVARWLTPNGISISKEGIIPDCVVPMTKKDTVAGLDPQLAKAKALLQ